MKTTTCNFRLSSDELICVKIQSTLEFNFKSTYMPGFNPSDEVLYQIVMSLSTEPESKSNVVYPWSEELSDKILYEVAAEFFDEEQEHKMNTSKSPTPLLQYLNINILKEQLGKTHLDCYRNTNVFNPLETDL